MLDTFNSSSPFLVAAASFGTFILSSDEHILTPQVSSILLPLSSQCQTHSSEISPFLDRVRLSHSLQHAQNAHDDHRNAHQRDNSGIKFVSNTT